MPKIEEWSQQLIKEAIKKITENTEEEVITDFHIATNGDNCEVRITDDNDVLLVQGNIDGFEEKQDEEFRKIIGRSFRQALSKLDAQHAFDALNLFRPFSFVLVDPEQDQLEDLYVVDNESIIINDELLKGLDNELNDFLNHLLEN